MEHTNTKIKELKASLADITKSGASPGECTQLKEKCEKLLANINKKCEAKVEELRQSFIRKSARDMDTETGPGPNKRPRIAAADPNNTASRNAAITQLIEVVNKVWYKFNQPEIR